MLSRDNEDVNIREMVTDNDTGRRGCAWLGGAMVADVDAQQAQPHRQYLVVVSAHSRLRLCA